MFDNLIFLFLQGSKTYTSSAKYLNVIAIERKKLQNLNDCFLKA